VPRGRWRWDEERGELVEEKSATPPPAPDELDAERRKRDQEERDAHPGTYL